MGSFAEGVLFDFGGTLYDYDPPNSVVWSRIAGRLGADIPPDDPRIWEGMRRQSVESARRARPFSRLSREEIRALNLRVLSAMGVGGEGAEGVVREEFDRRGHGYRINPESVETLGRICSMGLKIGLASNCPPEFGEPRRLAMEGDGVLRHFSAVLLSGEVGHGKPERVFFELALASLGLDDPSRVVFVGDSLFADAMGARNAGLVPVLYDPLGFHPGEGVATIRRLSEMFRYLM